MLLNPFQPGTDGTTTLAITASAQTMNPSTSGKYSVYRFSNIGTQPIYWIAYAAGSSVTPATTATGIPMLAGAVETFTLPVNPQVSVIAGSTGSTLSITPGEGI